ncbi:Uncharacterized protein TCAP_05444 [Tolypocladium capitatum]|uniref:Methyltransferase domain-containing protein n=1 Tax=Tolypocladium capitatum TaxID=45235 RepID=A0A2K3QAP7_9HYPO|nr:Uncharacterized protein TCAP_05444 [Tolypocladium capitatum]
MAYRAVFRDVCARSGLDLDPLPKVCGWLAELGADVVRERVDWVPLGSWGPDAMMRRKGALLADMIDCGFESWTLMLFRKAGWSEDDMRALVERVKEESRCLEHRTYVKIAFITARKSLAEDEEAETAG